MKWAPPVPMRGERCPRVDTGGRNAIQFAVSLAERDSGPATLSLSQLSRESCSKVSISICVYTEASETGRLIYGGPDVARRLID